MKNFFRIIFLICFVQVWMTEAKGQERVLLNVEFQDLAFEEFIEKIEELSQYRFYFNPGETEILKVNVQADRKSLNFVLEQAFEDTGFLFAIDEQARHVFITRDHKIQTELPVNFFKPRNNALPKEEESIVFDSFEEQRSSGSSKNEQLYEIGVKTYTIKPGKAILKGRVRDLQSGEPIFGASVFVEDPFIGASTDQFGYYSISLPKGRHVLKISSIGMDEEERRIVLYSAGKLDVELRENVVSLKEVVVSSSRDKNISNPQMGVERLGVKTIKQVPTVMGEADIVKVMLTLPGVKTVGEASTGFNVRGGSTDQNLILFNDAVIYNPSHLFGFFSSFNPEVIDEVELYKSSIPARFGGRLSSVLEVKPRYGNKKKFAGNAGIGLLTSKIALEGPIITDKTSFLVGVRGTYSNWLLNMLENPAYSNSRGSFFDGNLNLNHEIDDKNILSLTAYQSNDEFKLRSDTVFQYSNRAASFNWKRIFNDKLYGDLTASFSSYQYEVASEGNPVNAFGLEFGLDQSNFKSDFSYSLNAAHTLSFGLSTIHYKLQSGNYQPRGAESKVIPDVIPGEQALESALYLEDQFEISNRLTLNVGLRYSLYNYLGPGYVRNYVPDMPKNEFNLLDSVSFGSGELINSYHGPEYRLSARYMTGRSSSIKFSYNTLRQYIHMLSNTTAMSPTDVWKLSDPNIKPQFGDQISLGYYQNFKSGIIETSVEGYYKNIEDFLDYKGGAVLVMNHAIETDVLSTEGKAYGLEVMVKKLTGKFNGWVSYNWSRTLLKMNDPFAGENINNGDWYPANFDIPHTATFVGNYKFSHRFSVSLNSTYSTGRPVTLPIAKYEYNGSQRVLFSERNAHRVPYFFRTDVSMNIEGNHKVHQKTHNSWTIGVYNLTGRRNVFSTFFVAENGQVNGYKMSIFGTPIPYVNFNIRF